MGRFEVLEKRVRKGLGLYEMKKYKRLEGGLRGFKRDTNEVRQG